jgi:opacity protein-like surface antigen
MIKTLSIVVALIILAIPAVSPAAANRPGPYVSGFIGVSIPQNTDVTYNQYGGSTFNDNIEFDPSINIGGTGGYDFGFVRLEGELSYKQAEMSTINSTITNTGQNPPPSTQFVNVDGRIGALAMLFNCFIDLHNSTPVTPYFGGGIGFATLLLDDTFGTNVNGGGGGQLYWSDDDTVFAYQAGLGLEIAINRQLSLDVGYRYFGTAEANFYDQPGAQASLKLQSHNAAVGVRVKF